MISILVYIAVGNYAGRRVKHLEDYFVAGRQAPTVLIVGTLIASYLSTNAFLANTGIAYETHAGAWILWPNIAAMGYVYGALFFGRYLRRSRALTVAEYFGRRFDSRRVQTAAGVTIVLGLGGYLLAVTQGAAVLLSEITAVSYTQGLWVAWVSYTLFTLYAGSKGVVLTDTLMFFLFTTMSFLALYAIVDAHGGWLSSLESLTTLAEKPDLMTWHGIVGPGLEWESPADYLIWSIILGVAWSLVVAISPWQSSRYLMAKNEHVVIRSACVAAATVVLIEMTLYAAAGTVNLSKLDIFPKEESMIWAAMNILPPLLGALLLSGIMAAALSSATTFLSLVGFSVSNDIVPKRNTDDKSMLRFSRLTMLVVGAVVLLISLAIPQEIFRITYFVGTIFASSWGPVAFMSVWSDRVTANAAFWGIVSGFIGNALPKLLDTLGWIDLPSYLDPILIGGVISLAVIILVSRRGTVTAKERAYRLNLHATPPAECNASQVRGTRWAAIVVVVSGFAISVMLINFYVIPYQAITETLIDGQQVDWLTGEAIFALTWAALFSIFGILAYRVILRSYAPREVERPGLSNVADP